MHETFPLLLDIPNPFGDAPVYYMAETSSTMEDAAQLALNGTPSGTVVQAGYQHAGRGRFPDRRWNSGSGESLLFTLYLAKPSLAFPFPRLPLLTGLGVARLLESISGIRPKLKWPNDVLIDGRKICGILCEARGDSLLVGIGLNCNQRSFPPELDARATSIARLTGAPVEPSLILSRLLVSLHETFSSTRSASGLWTTGIEERLYRIGETITVKTGLPDRPESMRGRIAGIGEDGSLLLVPESGVEAVPFYSGELSIGS